MNSLLVGKRLDDEVGVVAGVKQCVVSGHAPQPIFHNGMKNDRHQKVHQASERRRQRTGSEREGHGARKKKAQQHRQVTEKMAGKARQG